MFTHFSFEKKKSKQKLGIRPLAVREKGRATREKSRSIWHGSVIGDYDFDRYSKRKPVRDGVVFLRTVFLNGTTL